MIDEETIAKVKSSLQATKSFLALYVIERLEEELAKEKRINEYIKARFVICNTCTDDERKKCLMFTEGLCEGERCEQIVDLESLIDKAAEAGTVR